MACQVPEQACRRRQRKNAPATEYVIYLAGDCDILGLNLPWRPV